MLIAALNVTLIFNSRWFLIEREFHNRSLYSQFLFIPLTLREKYFFFYCQTVEETLLMHCCFTAQRRDRFYLLSYAKDGDKRLNNLLISFIINL